MKGRPAAGGVLVLLLALPAGPAHAHLVTTGLGPVYDGITHFLLGADDLVPALALALLAGLNGAAAGRRALFMLAGAWLAGGCAGYLAGDTRLPEPVTTASFLVLGALVAANRPLSPSAVAMLAAVLGGLHGWLNGVGIAAAQREPLALAGIAAAVFVLSALVSAFVVPIRSGWALTAVRVAGSWVAAIGLLMLGWAFRPS